MRPAPPSPRRAALRGLLLLLALAACATPARRTGPVAPQAAPAGPAALPAPGAPVQPAEPREASPRTLARATFAAVGDVMIQEAVKRSAAVHGAGWPDEGYSWLFAPIADLLAEPDVMFANLETPVAPTANVGTREFMFNAPVASAAALLRAGFDVVSVTNNHAFDQGRPGFEETVARLDALGLRHVGAGPAGRSAGPLLLEVNGLRIALLAYAYGFNQPGNDCPAKAPGCLQASLLDGDAAVRDVQAATALADAVLVSVHWGVEYEQQPRPAEVDLARRLADAGALAVIGHHPHVLQPAELYRCADGRTSLIAHSLGNFVSNQSRRYVHGVTPSEVGATRDGALLRIALERRDYGHGVVRVELTGADYVPLWTENDTAEIDPKREPARRPAIRVVAVDRALAEVRAALAGFPDPVPAERTDAWVRLRQREALLTARRAASAAVMGGELVRTLTPAELATPVPGWAPESPGGSAR